MPSSADTIPSTLPFALALAAMAGAVDAIGVLRLGDVFVSFMSGNTTQLGIAASGLHGQRALRVAAVVAVFVAGVVLGEVVAARVAPRLRSTLLLGIVALALASAAMASRLALPTLAVALLLALSMGAQNAVVRRAGQVDVALTYVTGTLVHMSRAIAAALVGRGPWSRAVPFAGLWAAFALGAVVGGVASAAGTAAAIAGIAVAAVALALVGLSRFGRVSWGLT